MNSHTDNWGKQLIWKGKPVEDNQALGLLPGLEEQKRNIYLVLEKTPLSIKRGNMLAKRGEDYDMYLQPFKLEEVTDTEHDTEYEAEESDEVSDISDDECTEENEREL